ncbi:MAG: tRNA adenosine(34) deaminase TadA [Planctomycetia bacterium]
MEYDVEFHERFMRLALAEARSAAAADEVPIGAVVVRGEEVVAAGHNLRETRGDPTAHAEMIAIVRAATAAADWRLVDCRLYVTLEPCPMCAGAVVLARLPMVVFGAYDPKAGACGSLFRLTEDDRLNHRSRTIGGILEADCARLLTEFFAARRAEGKK